MKRMTVLLDCDGVLSNFTAACLRYLRDTFQIDRGEREVTTWRLEDALGLDPPTTTALKRRWSEPGFALELDPYPGAAKAVRELERMADVLVVTAPMTSSRTWHGDRERWLLSKIGVNARDVLHVSGEHKARVRGDALVEDLPETLAAWCAANPDGFGFLWDRPYNRHAGCPANAARVYQWRDVLGVLEQLAVRSEPLRML